MTPRPINDKKVKRREKWLLGVFLSVPMISSVISTIHLIDFVGLGNVVGMSIALAATFELGSLASFITISGDVLRRIKKGWIMFVFGLLFVLQAVGNVYSSFSFMIEKLVEEPDWLAAWQQMTLEMMTMQQSKLVLSMLIGLPIPIISLVLLKSAIDYVYAGDNEVTDKPKQDKKPDLDKPKPKPKRKRPPRKKKSKVSATNVEPAKDEVTSVQENKPTDTDKKEEKPVDKPSDKPVKKTEPKKSADKPKSQPKPKPAPKPEINKGEADISFIGRSDSKKKKASVRFPFGPPEDKPRDKNTEESGY